MTMSDQIYASYQSSMRAERRFKASVLVHLRRGAAVARPLNLQSEILPVRNKENARSAKSRLPGRQHRFDHRRAALTQAEASMTAIARLQRGLLVPPSPFSVLFLFFCFPTSVNCTRP